MQFDLCRRFGVRVFEVPLKDHEEDVVYVSPHNIVLVKAGLDSRDREEAADWVLSRCVLRTSSHPRLLP